MSKDNDQAWVTFVDSDRNVMEAMFLAQSIRITFSHRKVLALHGPNLSISSCKLLSKSFDGLIKMEKESTWKDCDWETYAKLYCCGLPFIKKCIFVSTSHFVTKNCDNIFDLEEQYANVANINESPILLIFTSIKKYLNMKENFELKSSDGFENFLEYASRKKTFFNLNGSPHANIQSTSQQLKIFLKTFNIENLNDIEISDYFETLSVTEISSLDERMILEQVFLLIQNKKMVVHYLNTTEPIAVVGMSARHPGANTLDEFWDLIMKQEDAIRSLPNDRWTKEQYYNINEEAKSMKAGWLKCPIDEFDANFFGMSPAELAWTDPQQRLTLEVIWEALEDSNINPQSLNGTTAGIFTGQWKFDYKEHLIKSGYQGIDIFRSYMGSGFGTTAARPSHFLGTTGPNIGTESGCSASMVAVGLAMKSLRNGDTNIAIAAGVNLILRPFYYDSLKHLLSKDCHSKSFDASADGFARAEGVGALVLKRLSDAVRDEDRIYALIRGFGQSQEGQSKSMGTPTVECEAAALQLALEDAGVNPLEVMYIETHGTGTPLGDPMEVKAIEKVYANGRVEPLIIASVKTNVGHTESCSGITGMIKTILALHKEVIPPHRCLNTLNPRINLQAIPAIIPLQQIPWKRQTNKRRLAGVSSFGISGTDAHVILEETPELLANAQKASNLEKQEHKLNVLTLSAKCEPALNEILRGYKNILKDSSELNFNDIAFTAAVGRAHLPHRVAIISGNCHDAASAIAENRFLRSIASDDVPKICFLYTGQGSQFAGMGNTLYTQFPVFKENFDNCDNYLHSKFGISIRHAMWEDKTGKVNQSLYSQTTIFAIQYSLTKLWESWGITPQAVLGHSLGEVAAVAAAGILNLEDALTLVAIRAQIIDNLPKGKMIVVKLNEFATLHLIKVFKSAHPNLWLDIAATNSETQTTVAGTIESVKAFKSFCQEMETKTHILEATHAFHSREMDAILDQIRDTASRLTYSQPTCEYISGLDGCRVQSLDANYFVRHTREAVSYLKATKVVYNEGSRIFVEVGPQPVLLSLLSQNVELKACTDNIYCIPSMKQSCNEEFVVLEALSQLYMLGVKIDWNQFYKHHNKQKITLPLYPFQRSKYWFNLETQDHYTPKSENQIIHPLIGHAVECPENVKKFRSFVSCNKLPQFIDHKIGSNVIFPASGFLEMALSAGFAAFLNSNEKFERPVIPITVTNFKIKSPLHFVEEKTYEFQTAISKLQSNTDDSAADVKIHSRLRGTGDKDTRKWTLNSESQFKFGSANITQNKFKLPAVWRNDSNKLNMEDVYLKLNNLGYNFGSLFKSLKHVWKENGEVFAEIDEISGKFFCHPIIIDAMIQSGLASLDALEDLQLPVFVEQFVLFPGIPRYIYVPSWTADDQNMKIFLLNEQYEAVAVMTGLRMAKTTLAKFNTKLQRNSTLSIPMFSENWLSSLQSDNVDSSWEIIPTPSSANQKLWIVFRETEGSFSDEIIKRLEAASLTVLQIKASSKFQHTNDNNLELVANSKTEMLEVFKCIKNNFSNAQLHGILYLWSLPTYESKFKMETSVLTESYLYLLQSILELDFIKPPLTYLVTRGQVHVGEEEALRPHASPLLGISKVFKNENESYFAKCIDLDPNKKETLLETEQVFNEISATNTDDTCVAFRNKSRFVPRLVAFDKNKNLQPLEFPNSNRYCLTLPKSKLISDLKFGFLLKKPLHEKEVEIEVKAAGLNFKDVLSVLKPTAEFENQNSIGADFAGIVKEIGQRVTKFKPGDAVMGCNLLGNALPSFVAINEDEIIPLPQTLTFAEGATIPVAFITAYHCLIKVAKLKRGERVLIHTASGGVGLLAIQIARHVGAVVFATAGSRRKRSYLKSLGIEHVYSSRDVSYGKMIMEVTNGEGIHVVLNSITGTGFKEASLNCCTKGARFIEMSKLNIWSVSEVEHLRADIFYSIEDLALPIPERTKNLMNDLSTLLHCGAISPTTYTSFEASKIKEALGFLEKAKQIGKVVCRMPEVKINNHKVEFTSHLFNDRSCYLVTGGLKGIGLQVAKWMAKNGAKYLVLCSRSQPNKEAIDVIHLLQRENVTVEIINADIGNYDECSKLLATLKDPSKKLPPLRGIMHSAGCLSDASILKQTWEKFQITMNPKVDGGWNLHTLTSNNQYNLEHFVLFSSMVALLGSPGQSNHCASNTFLDSLAHFRHSLGLPSTTINWGQWGETGVAAGKKITGVTPFTTEQGLDALEYVLKSNEMQVAVCAGDVTSWVKNLKQSNGYLEHLKSNVTNGTPEQALVSCEEFFDNLSKSTENKSKLEIIHQTVCIILAKILGFEGVEKIKKQQEFQDMGVDSLMMIEFRNQIQKILGNNAVLTANDMSDCITMEILTDKIYQLIYSKP